MNFTPQAGVWSSFLAHFLRNGFFNTPHAFTSLFKFSKFLPRYISALPGMGWKTFSHFTYLRGQHNTPWRAACCPRTELCGTGLWVFPSKALAVLVRRLKICRDFTNKVFGASSLRARYSLEERARPDVRYVTWACDLWCEQMHLNARKKHFPFLWSDRERTQNVNQAHVYSQ